MFFATDRALRSGIAAHTTLSPHDPHGLGAAARAASAVPLNERLLAEVYPTGAIPEPECGRRFEHAELAHFPRLSLRSAATRRKAEVAAAHRAAGVPADG